MLTDIWTDKVFFRRGVTKYFQGTTWDTKKNASRMHTSFLVKKGTYKSLYKDSFNLSTNPFIALHTNTIKGENDSMVKDNNDKHISSKREAHISKWIGILLSILIFACNSAYHLMLIYRICYQLLSKGICLNTDIKISLWLYVCSLEC